MIYIIALVEIFIGTVISVMWFYESRFRLKSLLAYFVYLLFIFLGLIFYLVRQ